EFGGPHSHFLEWLWRCRLERQTALGELGAAKREERASSGQAKALRTCGSGEGEGAPSPCGGLYLKVPAH
ncbi:unnamed protein product, partial [Rangifer tarandus platyrhynchus]